MYLLYLDDSGSTGNLQEQHLVLGGVCVFERQVHWAAKEMEELATRIQPANPEAVEFHASEIYPGRTEPWKGMKSKEERRHVIRDVLGIVARAHDTTHAFACVVHKASFPNADPMEIAFEELCSRFDMELKRMYAKEKDAQRGLIILDKSTHETSLQKLARNFRSLGTRWGVLVNMVDVPMFVDSAASRLVQIADHIAYAVFRRYEAGDTSYLDIILNKFVSENGKLHSLVHRQTTNPDCLCPACMSRKLPTTRA
jgi:hypothetical protein